MQTIPSSIAFGPTSGSGPQVQQTTVSFAAAVTQAVAILTGFVAEFSGGDDHHLGKLDVRVSAGPPNGTDVVVTATFGLRDWSGDWDDKYDGQVFFTVVGDP
jgi:hypothetical protein